MGPVQITFMVDFKALVRTILDHLSSVWSHPDSDLFERIACSSKCCSLENVNFQMWTTIIICWRRSSPSKLLFHQIRYFFYHHHPKSPGNNHPSLLNLYAPEIDTILSETNALTLFRKLLNVVLSTVTILHCFKSKYTLRELGRPSLRYTTPKCSAL